MREKDLEDFLFHHPYLIDERFTGVTPRRQVRRSDGRLDLIFNLAEGWCIAELKITKLTAKDVEQLAGYCREWRKTDKLASPHLIIGKRPRDDKKLQEAIQKSEFQIKPIFLGEQIPTQLVFDEDSRLYRPLQPDESAIHIFPLD
jgi:hypothetical protein